MPPSLPQQPAWVKEFKAFIMRGNVLDLAVGITAGCVVAAVLHFAGRRAGR